jgi:flagellar assembly factor FliW
MSTLLTVESSRFGTLELDPAAVIEFPAGLIGLGGHRFAIVAPDEDSAFRWLHSLEDGDLALPVTSPWEFFADYQVALSDEDSERVGAEGDEVAVWVTVRTGSELSDFSANLRAPIVIAHGRGHQVINEAPEAPVRAPLFPEALAGQAA